MEKRLTAQISDENMTRLKVVAARLDLTLKEAITEAITIWLAKQEAKLK